MHDYNQKMIIDKFDELFGKISKRDLKIQKLK